MKLLYILSEFPPGFGGGIATVYGRLLPELVNHGHTVTVLLADILHCDQASYIWKGVRVEPLQSCFYHLAIQEMEAWNHHGFLHNFLPAAWAAWLQAAQFEKPDLVEVTDWGLLFVPWLIQQRRHPVVVSLHGSCGQVDWHGNPSDRRGEGQVVRLLEATVLPLADGVIANSNLNAKFWWQQCGVRPHVIPPLVGELTGSEVAPAPIGLSQRGARSDRGVVVGRLQNWKGPEVLCSALRLLPGQQVDWIGQDTAWEESTISTAAHLRRMFPDVVDHQLHLLGKLPVNQVQSQISEAAFLCVPSLWDVFNVTVLEAIAAGTPVICSKHAGAAMLVAHGLTGYLFDPHHVEELVDAISAVASLNATEHNRLTARAREQTAGLIKTDQVASQHQTLYRDSIEGFLYREASPWLSDALKKGMGPIGANRFDQQGRHVYSLLRQGWRRFMGRLGVNSL